jgi:DNA-binding beta-propeller fold protein YncE
MQYFQTGKPIADIEAVPRPIARLVQEAPQFTGSIWNVARPLGVAVGPDGTIYVTESDGERMIRAFASDGTLKAAFAPPGTQQFSRNPIYLAVSSAGQLYVSDLIVHTIFIFSAGGENVGQVPSPFEEGWMPQALAFDLAGNLFVTDVTPGAHRVVVLDSSGRLVREFGKEGAARSEFSFPNGIAVDRKGNIYVADSGNGRVQVFDRDGAFLFAIGRGTAKGDLGMPRGIVVDDERKQLLVVDTTDHEIKVYDIAGATPKFLYALDGGGAAVAAFRFPNGIALDGKGHIFVADRENHRVAVWRY